MVELKGVKKSYITKGGVVNALDDITLTLPSTGLIFILGKSGSGKTTLLNVIGGLDGIDEGEMRVQDKDFSLFSPKECDSYRNTMVGFVFQEYNLLSEYTVEYNIKIAMELQGRPVNESEFEKLLKDVEIEELRKRKPSELSGGQRQRVAIARALVKQPRIIMADEPTGALDSQIGAQVFDTLKKLSKERLVIVVSHDNEFAEKYADRVIRLVDGKIVGDITFTEKELNSNINVQENVVVVKEGSDLSATEKDVLANAVKARKKIQLTEHLYFREQEPTGEVITEKTTPIELKKSKMKLKSSAYLGVKFLMVKPMRLLITILISAFAFAIFGLFDTIADFSVQKSLHNRFNKGASTVVATTDYVLNNGAQDKYNVKLSDGVIDVLMQETGGVVKGIFDFRDNLTGKVSQTQSIAELSETGLVIGKRYYTNEINGFIEFDAIDEINGDGTFKDFKYTITAGEYPSLRYNDERLEEESLYEVAISEYLADSIIYYLNGRALGEKSIENREDLLGCTISVQQNTYKIVGMIDCGEIPDKYDVIKGAMSRDEGLKALFNDFDAFINASAQKCLFVADGFRETIKGKSNSADIYYMGNIDREMTLSNPTFKKQVTGYVYNSEKYDENNIVLFNDEYLPNGEVLLADNQVLVHSRNLEYVFKKEIETLGNTNKEKVRKIIQGLEGGTKETVRTNFHEILQIFGKTDMMPVTATVDMRSAETGEALSQEVSIVGFYFGVDAKNVTSISEFKLMMNASLMDTLLIYPEQGDYTKILFSQKSAQKGADTLVEYLTRETGLSFVLYRDSVLTIIQENEEMVHQAADLFLYAALGLAAFSIFMLYNYISTCIANKRRSIGVLRGLGASGKDIFLTFLFESLLIGLINSIFANILCVVGCALVNSYIMNTMNIYVAFALFGVRQIFMIVGLSLLTSVVSSALPIARISKKKPVELIRNS